MSSLQPENRPSPLPRPQPIPGTPLPSPTPEPPPSLEGLRLEILNGSGAPKVALKLSVALDRRRIRTLRVDNADRWNYAKTLLRPAPGQEARARALAGILGLSPAEVQEAPAPTDADIVLILGQDHDAVLKAASRRDVP